MLTAHRWPALAARIRGPFRALSLVFFAVFVVGALVVNWDFFLQYVGRVVLFVFLLNAFALLTGYFTARVARLPEADRRAVALEVGIQNSGFGLALVFNVLRRPRRHGDRRRLVGHLAHRGGHHARRDLAPAAAAAGRCRSRRMTAPRTTGRRILVTAAPATSAANWSGRWPGSGQDPGIGLVVASDVREMAQDALPAGVVFVRHDVRSPGLAAVLAAPPASTRSCISRRSSRRARARTARSSTRWTWIGTRNVLDACIAAGVRQLVVTSSGAAYGYHADNPAWLTEDDPDPGQRGVCLLAPQAAGRGNARRLPRDAQPQLRQVVFRVGTILGETTRNQITALFDKPRLIAMRGSRSPFVFIWDQDVVGAIEHAIRTDAAGIYNVAGDGALSIQEIAARLGKPLPDAAAGLPCGWRWPCCTRCGCRATAPSRSTSCAIDRCSTTAG